MKAQKILLALGLVSTSAFANTYDKELNVAYSDNDYVSMTAIEGRYYFDAVNTDNTAWAEAEFMGKKTNVGLSYIHADADFGGSSYALGLNGRYYNADNNIFAALNYLNPEEGDSVIQGELGYFFGEHFLVAVGKSDIDDSPFTFRTKYMTQLTGDSFLNVELMTDDELDELDGVVDYYFSSQTSIGLGLTTRDTYDAAIKARHFFNKQFSAQVSYTFADVDDVIEIGVTARF
ncbi:putative porin [Pseudoalteromonas sp. C2R02]|uniref:putative porin n=1 Tax=Pseudoalteromonas sp. C2R02 TaxID=2841565 RepID=UPI001C0A4875|nr:putative porin [Pseudoalteromonas sp. C2R02]MBU2968221.1 putative porin [Pseudoalteromonas sp. C2R02]